MQRMTGWVRMVSLFIVGSCLSLMSLAATTPVYVDDDWTGPTNCGGHAWGTNAFNNIQSAVDNCKKDGIVWVNDGLYNTGGKKWLSTSNRVALTQRMTLQSVNGPLSTIIEGVADPVSTNGPLAMRCVFMTNNPALIGFTVRNGHTEIDSTAADIKHAGGGVFMTQGGTVSNCIIQGNTGYRSGGGIFADGAGKVYNCLIIDNQVGFKGGGVHIEHGGAVINNSTIAFNSAGVNGGGMDIYWGGDAKNCIIYYNTSPASPNWSVSGVGSFNNCDTIPLTGISGSGNIDADPLFMDADNDNFKLHGLSPCLNKGQYDSWMTNTIDLAGNPRVYGSTVDIGAYEMVDPVVFVDDDWTGPTNCGGRTWGVDAFSVIQTAVDAAPSNSTVWVYEGFYDKGGAEMYGSNRVVLAKPITLKSVYGPANTLIVGQPDPVTTNGPGAFRGVYMTNGAVLAGFTVTNGYGFNNPMPFPLKSSGGGIYMDQGGMISNCIATRCSVYAWGGGIYCNKGTVIGCSVISNNEFAPRSFPGLYGGGIYCKDGTLTHSIVDNNFAVSGGGVYLIGTSKVENCIISSNSAVTGVGGGVYGTGPAMLDDCLIVGNVSVNGGGIYAVDGFNVNHCFISSNTALSKSDWTGNGGGVYCIYNHGGRSTITDSLITGNSARQGGGIQGYGTVKNSTVIFNSAYSACGGVGNCIVLNCVIVSNTAPIELNLGDASQSSYTCTTPLPTGTGNIDADPLFVDPANGDYRLQATSPCIDAGLNETWMVYDYDLDGNPRLIDGNGDATATVDMGAYELLPTP